MCWGALAFVIVRIVALEAGEKPLLFYLNNRRMEHHRATGKCFCKKQNLCLRQTKRRIHPPGSVDSAEWSFIRVAFEAGALSAL